MDHSQGMGRDRRLPRDRRRAQLLACALKVFAEHGLGAGNHAMVAREAGVSVPTVFSYFSTREDLLDAVLAEVEHFIGEVFETALHDDRPADLAVMHLIGNGLQLLDSHPYHVRVVFEWALLLRADIWPRYVRLDRMMLKALTRMIERGQREGVFRPDIVPEDEAHILHAASRAITQMKLTDTPQARIKRFHQSIVQSLLVPGAVEKQRKDGRPADHPAARPPRTVPARGRVRAGAGKRP